MSIKHYIVTPILATALLASSAVHACGYGQDQENPKTYAYFTFTNQDPSIDKPSRLYKEKIEDIRKAADSAGLREFKIVDKSLSMNRYSMEENANYEFSFTVSVEFAQSTQGYDAFLDVGAIGVSFNN